MAASDLHHHKPPSRQASLQRMLDLEKKYKLARLHSAQTSPVSESITSFPAPPRPPIQARRRDSKESLAQKQSDPTLKATRRTVPPPNLSINIPPPGTEKQREDTMFGDSDERRRRLTDDDDATPREKTVTFLSLEEDEESGDSDDDDTDRKSEQSSICQSPSWEGYGEKKKKKKLEAEQKRKEKELAEQEIKAAKKRLAHRLYKSPPPPDSPATERSGSTSLRRGESYQSAKPPRPEKHRTQSYIPEWAGLAMAYGGYVPGLGMNKTYPTNVAKAITSLPASTIEPEKTNGQAKKAIEPAPSTEASRVTSVDSKGLLTADVRAVVQSSHSMLGDYNSRPAVSKSPRSMTMTDAAPGSVSYPPPASRSRALRHTTGNSHGRSNSASAATAAKMEEASRFFKAQNMKSTQGSNIYGTANISEESFQNSSVEDRGRLMSNSHGYVHNARAQSAERAIAGYLDDVAVSSVPKPVLPASSKQQIDQQDPEATPTSPIKATEPEKDGSQHDYFSFVTKQYTAPPLDLNTPSSNILSSIRSKLTRRASANSTSTMSRSSGERTHPGSHAPSQATAQHSSQAAPQAASKTKTDLHAPSSVPSSGRPSAVYSPTQVPKDFGRLPKAARVLGEVNAMTMQNAGTAPGSRPSEGSSTSSYHDDSSGPPSPASTPDTSRPQSARGLTAAIDEAQKITSQLGEHGSTSQSQPTPGPDSTSGTTRSSSSSSKTQLPTKDGSGRNRYLDTDRPSSKGRPLEDLTRPVSRGRLLDDLHRTSSETRLPDLDDKIGGQPCTVQSGEALANSSRDQARDDEWSRSALPMDFDSNNESFVTSLTSLPSLDALNTIAPVALQSLNAEVAKTDGSTASDCSRPSSRQSRKSEDDGSRERERPRSRGSRKKEKTGGSHHKKMSIVNEEPKMTEEPPEIKIDPSGQPNAAEVEAINGSFLPPLKPESLLPPKSKARTQTSTSAPGVIESHRTYAKAPFVPSEPSSGRSTPSASYLQEARRTAPNVPSPLGSNSSNNSKTKAPLPPPMTASRLGMKSMTSTPAVMASRPALLAGKRGTSTSSAPQFRIPAQEPEQSGKPVAKMLVECCSCKFFHDMPSRVYECMASPDAVVTDRNLGVSGAITTMVKCPWCSHNMSTQCCAGYAAVVYLKERMH